MDTTTASQIIDALGGTSEAARLCRVSAPSVSDWRKNGIPPARLMFLRLARPDLDWKALAPDDPPPQANNPEVRARELTPRSEEDRRREERRQTERRDGERRKSKAA